MDVTLNYFIDVDIYDDKEFYYGEIISIKDKDTLYSHQEKLKCFSYKEDMVFDLHKVCAEHGYKVVDINDQSIVPSMWEEYI